MPGHLVSTIRGAAVVFAMTVTFAATSANAADDIAAKAQVCSACHGQNGVASGPTIPIIWGQQSNYLYKELHDYHSGARVNAIMAPLAKGSSLDELRQIADYFAAKSWPAQSSATPSATAPEAIAGKIEMCRACHGKNFEGGAPAPRLAGLSYEYLRGAMNSFADGQRTNNLDMPGFMKVLSDGDRDAIAHYLSGL